VGQARGMYSLMELADNDLLDVLLGRPHTQTVTKDPRVQSVLHLLKV
jgi:succinate dehydrogenase flavin-adding protein (antitoxin of CptAB toxin-antitoxin module)